MSCPWCKLPAKAVVAWNGLVEFQCGSYVACTGAEPIQSAKCRVSFLEADVERLRASLREAVRRMRKYAMDIDIDAPADHREFMDSAAALLVDTPQPEDTP